MDSLLGEKLISVKDAVALTGYGPDHLTRLCRTGKVLGTRVGRSWLIDRASLVACLEGNKERRERQLKEVSKQFAREYEITAPVKPVSVVSQVVAPIPAVTEVRVAPTPSPYYRKSLVGALAVLVIAVGAVGMSGAVNRSGTSDMLASAGTASEDSFVGSVKNFAEDSARFTYEAVNTIFGSTGNFFASMFAPATVVVETVVETPAPVVSYATTTVVVRETVVQEQGSSVVNEYYTVTSTGVSAEYVEERIKLHIENLDDRIDNRLDNVGGGGGSGGSGSVTSVDVSGGSTGLSFGGGPIISSGTMTLSGTLGIANGGTGITTAPAYGQLLLGNSLGGYDLVATSSLGFVSGGSPVWGAITGTLSNQTDLQNALNAKLSLTDWYATTTDGLTEGSSNFYFTNARTQTFLDTVSKGYFFSTTSADYWETGQTARTADDLSNNSIEDLSDVAIMTKSFGDLLYWNGSSWADIATSSLGIAGSSSFDYLFPSNATTTNIAFNGGLSASTLSIGSLSGVLYGNSGAVSATATTSATLGLGLSGTLTTLGSSDSLSIATSSLFTGTTGQVAYFSGTNQPVGTSSLAIGAGGNIGIGTTNPGSLLEINGTAQAITAARGLVSINSNSTQAAGVGGTIGLGGSDGTQTRDFANIGGLKENSSSGNYAGYLSFATRSHASAPAERMRIDSSGNVGIGTTTPAERLSVQGNALVSGNTSTAGLTATGTVQFTGLSNGLVYANGSGVLSAVATSSWSFASSTLLADTNTWSALQTFSSGINVNGESFTDLTGAGLQNIAGVLSLNATGDWTGTFDGQEGSYYLNRANHTGTQLASTISDFNASVNSYIHASTTIPKTYTANTFTGAQTFNGGLTVGSLNGVFYGVSGVMNAVATSTPTLGLGLSYSGTLGSFVGGSSGALSIATSSLFTGTQGQVAYFSGTNQPVGTSSLFIATSGNVGIGTTSPGFALDVAGGVGFGALFSNQLTSFYIDDNIGTGNPGINFDANDYIDYNRTNNQLDIAVGGGVDLTISPLGNVGIGTTTPTEKLSLLSGDNLSATNIFAVRANNLTQGVGIGYNTIRGLGTNQGLTLDTPGTGNLTLATGGGSRLTVDGATGYVGIGTSTPAQTFSVSGNGYLTGGLGVGIVNTNAGSIRSTAGAYFSGGTTVAQLAGSNYGDTILAYSGGGDVQVAIGTGNPGYIGTITNHDFALKTNNTVRLTVNTSGNVGIGTTNPEGALSIAVSGTTVAGGQLATGQSNAAHAFDWGIRASDDGADDSRSAIRFNTTVGSGGSDSNIQFITNHYGVSRDVRMTIDKSGNIGIGTTTPNSKLQVIGGNVEIGPSYGSGTAYDTGNRTLQVGAYTGTPTLSLQRHNTEQFNIFVNSSGHTEFSNAGGTRMTIQSSTGNVGIGVTPVVKLDVAGSMYLRGAPSAGALFAILPDATSGANGITLDTSFATGGYGPLIFKTNGSEMMRLTTGGDIAFASGGQIDFANEVGDKLYLYEDIYGIGIESNNLTNWSASQFRWRVGGTSVSAGTEVMTLSSAALSVPHTVNFSGGSSITTDGVNRINLNASNYVYVPSGTLYVENTMVARGGLSDDGGALGLLDDVYVSGNVGIGTTSPYAKLSVVGPVVAEYFHSTSTTASVFGGSINVGGTGQQYVGFSTGANALALNASTGTGLTSTASIFMNIDSNNDETIRYFAVGNNNNTLGSATELFRVQENGYVGIGDSTPSYSLDVAGIISGQSYIVNDANAYRLTDDTGNAWVQATGGAFGIGTASPGNTLTIDGTGPVAEIRSGGYLMMRPTANDWDMRLQAGAGNKLHVYSGGDVVNPIATFVHGGNVGIGTSSPLVRLDLGQATNGWIRGTGMYLEDHDGSTGKLARLYNYGEHFGISREAANVGGYEATLFDIALSDGTAYFVGNLGLGGDTAPAAKLSISNGATDGTNYGRGIQITNLNGNSQQIAFIRNGMNVISAGYDGASSRWGFGPGQATDSNFDPGYFSVDLGTGAVGIGSTTPNKKLVVAGGIRASLVFAGDGIFVDSGGSSIFSLTRQDAVSTADLAINAYGGVGIKTGNTSYYDTPSTAYNFYINPSGNVGIGTTTPNSKFVVQGGTSEIVTTTTAGAEVVDWPQAALSIRRNDNFTVMKMLQFGHVNDNPYQTGHSVWNFSLVDDSGSKTTSDANTDLTIGGPGDFVFSTTGNVGIGDTSPAALLTVGNGDLFQVNSSGAIAAVTTINASGAVTASQFNGSGAGLTSGTVPIASLVAGDYSGKVTSGTYSINISGSAGTLDSIDSTQFLRSDAGDTRDAGQLTIFQNTSGQTFNAQSTDLNLSIQNPSGGDAFMTFHVGGDFAGYFGLGGAENDFVVGGWSFGNNRYRVWHSGNDGAGSTLDADTLDGISSASFLQTTSIDTSSELLTILTDETGTGSAVFSASPTFTGTLAGADANFTGRVTTGTGYVVSTQDDISARTNSGFFQSSSATIAEGWPVDDGSWQHLISSTHSNDANYYSLQLGGSFFDQNLYFRKTNNNGTAAWTKIVGQTDIDTSAELATTVTDETGSGSLVFATSPVFSGTLRVGTTNSGAFGIRVAGNIGPDADASYNLGSGSLSWACVYYDGGSSGNSCISDRRLKENIEDKGFESALEKLTNLRLRSFTYKGSEANTPTLGFIAQEVMEVAPEFVFEREDGYYGVRYSDVNWLTFSALQELAVNVESLASTSPMDAEEGSFAARFFGNLLVWFADTANGIGDFVADRVRTNELCVTDEEGETCLSRVELQALLAGASAVQAEEDEDEEENEEVPVEEDEEDEVPPPVEGEDETIEEETESSEQETETEEETPPTEEAPEEEGGDNEGEETTEPGV